MFHVNLIFFYKDLSLKSTLKVTQMLFDVKSVFIIEINVSCEFHVVNYIDHIDMEMKYIMNVDI